ncbi:hypothetical protein JPSP30_03450 [Staphylococcus pseudintermedius]
MSLLNKYTEVIYSYIIGGLSILLSIIILLIFHSFNSLSQANNRAQTSTICGILLWHSLMKSFES